MNTKYVILSFFFSCSPFTVHGMEENTAEHNLFAKKTSIHNYLLQIEHGLYGPNIAQQLHDIHSAIYIPSTSEQTINLYGALAKIVEFAIGSNGGHSPEKIRPLLVNQIQAKYRMLLTYQEKGLIQMPLMSPEEADQLPFVSGE